MTPEKNKSFVEEKRNTEDGVLSLGGEDVISLSYALEYLVNFAYYCTCLGEELKAKAPPKTTPCGS